MEQIKRATKRGGITCWADCQKWRTGERNAAEHKDYIFLVSAELIRDLRICRNVYGEYLGKYAGSTPAKSRLALDLAVAPRASQRLREECVRYLRNTGVDDETFARLFDLGTSRQFGRPNLVLNIPSMEDVLAKLIPDNVFRGMHMLTSRELDQLEAGPFEQPAEPSVGFLDFLQRDDEALATLSAKARPMFLPMAPDELWTDRNKFWATWLSYLWKGGLRNCSSSILSLISKRKKLS